MYIWFLFRQLQNKWQFSITTNWLFIFLKFITPAFNSPHPHSPKKPPPPPPTTTTTNNNNNNNNNKQQQQQQNNNTKQHKKSKQKRSSLLVLSEMRHWMVVNWSSAFALWGCTDILLGAMLWVQLNSLLSYLPWEIKVFQLKGYKHLKACVQENIHQNA